MQLIHGMFTDFVNKPKDLTSQIVPSFDCGMREKEQEKELEHSRIGPLGPQREDINPSREDASPWKHPPATETGTVPPARVGSPFTLHCFYYVNISFATKIQLKAYFL